MNGETKWTPGPWRVATRIAHKYAIQGGTDDVPIWTAHAIDTDACSQWDHEPTAFANAHLIAAAPELYEAADKALAFLVWLREERVDFSGFASHEAEVELRSALAKARGEGS